MGFNLIELHFDSKEQMAAKIEELAAKGICSWNYDEEDCWAQFDISGCKASDLPELFPEL